MKVYVLNLVAEFDNDSHNEVYVYDSFEKAHKDFMEIIGEWFNEDLFDTTKPDGNSSKIWETDEYEGHYAKYPNSDYLFIQERDNVVNFLTAYVEEREVM